MTSEFDSSVLAIVNTDSNELLGTGLVVSSNLVLTCAHLFNERKVCKDGSMKLPENIAALSDGVFLRPAHIYNSEHLDLCCLYFPAIAGAVPVHLVRSAQLQKTALTAVGFTSDQITPRRHLAHALKVIHELQSDGKRWLQFGQLQGGVPQGFSGGPVLAETSDGWGTVGMLQLGRESAPISRFIGVDPIASFLAEHGMPVAIGEFRPAPVSAPPRSEPGIHIGSINNSQGVTVTQKNIKKAK